METAWERVPSSRGRARITAAQTDTSPIPAGYRLNRAMASILRRMFCPPLAMEEVPGVRGYRSLAMDRRMRP